MRGRRGVEQVEVGTLAHSYRANATFAVDVVTGLSAKGEGAAVSGSPNGLMNAEPHLEDRSGNAECH
jgi:hypothetical protein